MNRKKKEQLDNHISELQGAPYLFTELNKSYNWIREVQDKPGDRPYRKWLDNREEEIIH